MRGTDTEAEDTQVSVAVPMAAVRLVATAELGLAEVPAAMARGIIHPESRLDTTATTGGMDRGTTHREAQLEARFMVPARDRKVEPLPSSLLHRQVVPEATTSPETNPLLALRANRASSNAPAQLQRVQPGPTGLGRDRMQPTGSDSTLKQRKDCVTGKAERLDTPTQNVITRNTGVIVITTIMTGGVTIATLSFLLGEVFGAGMTAGGIRPGATIRIIPTMITMVPSMATMDFDPTRSLPTFRQRCSNWDITNTQLTECWDRQLKQPLRITSATTGFPSREQSINQR